MIGALMIWVVALVGVTIMVIGEWAIASPRWIIRFLAWWLAATSMPLITDVRAQGQAAASVTRETFRLVDDNKEEQDMKNVKILLMYGLMLCLVFGLAGASANATPQAAMRIVQGDVIATNLEAEPPVIVVREVLPNKEELIVGATVPPDTHVTRGKRTVALADIHVGERVVLGYLKQPDGLTARSIHVR